MSETQASSVPQQPAMTRLDITDVYDILNRLGITANYKGFHHAAYAVLLAVEDPERLLLVTKCLYPLVAAQYHTNANAVERNIRTVINRIWAYDPRLLHELVQYPLQGKPTSSQFLSTMVTYFSLRGDGALIRGV